MNHPVLVLICLHLSVLAHVWSYMLCASGSRLSCQPCRRRCLPEVLVWTGKLKAQQPWTLSTGMCVLTKGLSAGLTPVFLSVFSGMRACGLVSMCMCRVAKTRSQFRSYRSSMRPTKVLHSAFLLQSRVARPHVLCASLDVGGKKSGLLQGHKLTLFFCLFWFYLKEKLAVSKTLNQQQHPPYCCTSQLITLSNLSHQIYSRQIFEMSVVE